MLHKAHRAEVSLHSGLREDEKYRPGVRPNRTPTRRHADQAPWTSPPGGATLEYRHGRGVAATQA